MRHSKAIEILQITLNERLHPTHETTVSLQVITVENTELM